MAIIYSAQVHDCEVCLGFVGFVFRLKKIPGNTATNPSPERKAYGKFKLESFELVYAMLKTVSAVFP